MAHCKELEVAQQLKPPQAAIAGNIRLGQITAELQHQLGERKHADVNGSLEQAEVCVVNLSSATEIHMEL